MSICAACFAALAIETRLQLLDRGAGQDQRLMVEDVVDIGADRREEVDLPEIGRGLGKADRQGVAVDDERVLAEVEPGEALLDRLGLGLVEVEILDDDEVALARLGRQGHPEAEGADLLVQRRIEVADARAVRLAAADEDRCAAIAGAGGAAALLLAVLLAGAGDVGPLAGGAGGAAALLELPRHHAVEDIGARLDVENLVVEIDVLAGLAVQGLNFDLHGLAFLAFGGFRRSRGLGRGVSGSVVVLGGLADAGRIGSGVGAGDLDGVLDEQPAALVARDRALDEDEAAIGVGADHLEILLGAVLGAHVAGHLLVLEDAARILTLAGRAQ